MIVRRLGIFFDRFADLIESRTYRSLTVLRSPR